MGADSPPSTIPPGLADFDTLADALVRDHGLTDLDLHYSHSALLLSRKWELWGQGPKRRMQYGTGATPTEAAADAIATLAARPSLAAVKP